MGIPSASVINLEMKQTNPRDVFAEVAAPFLLLWILSPAAARWISGGCR